MGDGEPTGYRGRFWIGTRLYWSTAILLVVGIVATLHYPANPNPDFYATAAQVIVTLYVAMAIQALGGDAQGIEISSMSTGCSWSRVPLGCWQPFVD